MTLHTHKLDDIILQASADSRSIIVISNTSIKNQVATSISHIHSHSSSIIKTIHQAINVSSTEAELFTIRCSINQATQIPNVNCIIVITDSIHVAKRFFDLSLYSFQIYSLAIATELREFFTK